MLQPLWLALCGLLATSLLLRSKGLVLTSGLLLANWLIGYGHYRTTGNDYDWALKAYIDIPCAVLLLIGEARLGQIVIAALYITMLFTHLGFALAGNTPDSRYIYWWSTYYLAIAQAVVLLLWSGWDGGKVVRLRFGSPVDLRAHPRVDRQASGVEPQP